MAPRVNVNSFEKKRALKSTKKNTVVLYVKGLMWMWMRSALKAREQGSKYQSFVLCDSVIFELWKAFWWNTTDTEQKKTTCSLIINGIKGVYIFHSIQDSIWGTIYMQHLFFLIAFTEINFQSKSMEQGRNKIFFSTKMHSCKVYIVFLKARSCYAFIDLISVCGAPYQQDFASYITSLSVIPARTMWHLADLQALYGHDRLFYWR